MPLPGHLSEQTLGYRIHTNRELGMMLRREKPLSVFCDVEGFFSAAVLRYLRMFDRHVWAGRFVRQEHRTQEDHRGRHDTILTILYALPDQAWRIHELINLRAMSPWNPDFERGEGLLLGYSEEQCTRWIALKYSGA
jgi:hypothetical protein